MYLSRFWGIRCSWGWGSKRAYIYIYIMVLHVLHVTKFSSLCDLGMCINGVFHNN